MAAADDPHAEIRKAMTEALEQEKWEFNSRSKREGLEVFRRHSRYPTLDEMIDYVLALLEDGFPLKEVELHDAPHGIGYEMENTDGKGLYIKLKYDWPYVLVLSFHDSDRPSR